MNLLGKLNNLITRRVEDQLELAIRKQAQDVGVVRMPASIR